MYYKNEVYDLLKNFRISKETLVFRAILVWEAQVKKILFEQKNKDELIEMLEIILQNRLIRSIGLSAFVIIFGILPWVEPVNASQPKKIKDYGTRGHTFQIKERSLLEAIEEKLKISQENGTIKNLEKKFQDKVKQKISCPIAVLGIGQVTVRKERIFDPTYTQETDVKDHLGRIIVSKGTTVNPLDHVGWGEPLLFINGEDLLQVKWAIEQEGKIILVKGAPLELEKKYHRWFYFDQAGLLSKKFAITVVPTRISQDGKVLKIEEIKL